MNNPITQAALDAIAPRVLERLQGLTSLPSDGVVAGQAVASIVFEELGLPLRGPINDIDIFVPPHVPRSERGLKEIDHTRFNFFTYHAGTHRQKTAPTTFNKGTIVADVKEDYSQTKFLYMRSSIKILHTYRRDLNNYTLFLDFEKSSPTGATSYTTPPEVASRLVGGFDINAVQVGIHLPTKTLHATPHFLDFLNNKDLKVVTAYTPAHSLLRLAKKFHGQEIQGATCDFSYQRTMLEAALAIQTHGDILANPPPKDSQDVRKKEMWLNQVISFGTRMENVRNLFADHLPPSTSYTVAQGDEGYQMHMLEIDPNQWPASLRAAVDRLKEAPLWKKYALADQSCMDGQPSIMASSTATKDFPALFELFAKPHFTNDDLLRQAMFLSIEEESEQVIAQLQARHFPGIDPVSISPSEHEAILQQLSIDNMLKWKRVLGQEWATIISPHTNVVTVTPPTNLDIEQNNDALEASAWLLNDETLTSQEHGTFMKTWQGLSPTWRKLLLHFKNKSTTPKDVLLLTNPQALANWLADQQEGSPHHLQIIIAADIEPLAKDIVISKWLHPSWSLPSIVREEHAPGKIVWKHFNDFACNQNNIISAMGWRSLSPSVRQQLWQSWSHDNPALDLNTPWDHLNQDQRFERIINNVWKTALGIPQPSVEHQDNDPWTPSEYLFASMCALNLWETFHYNPYTQQKDDQIKIIQQDVNNLLTGLVQKAPIDVLKNICFAIPCLEHAPSLLVEALDRQPSAIQSDIIDGLANYCTSFLNVKTKYALKGIPLETSVLPSATVQNILLVLQEKLVLSQSLPTHQPRAAPRKM